LSSRESHLRVLPKRDHHRFATVLGGPASNLPEESLVPDMKAVKKPDDSDPPAAARTNGSARPDSLERFETSEKLHLGQPRWPFL
jgi:hypothetical protein